MKNADLRKLGIEITKIDNGYKVAPSYEYKFGANKVVLDKENNYGTAEFVLSVDDNLIKNPFGKILFWETKEDVLADIVDMLVNYKMPSRSHTYCY